MQVEHSAGLVDCSRNLQKKEYFRSITLESAKRFASTKLYLQRLKCMSFDAYT
jgi:hypothetical protein